MDQKEKKQTAEEVVKEILRKISITFSPEEKIKIVLLRHAGLRHRCSGCNTPLNASYRASWL